MGVSLLPVVFLFFSSYALVNRTLNLWFPRPLEIANEESQVLLNGFGASEAETAERAGFRSGHARNIGSKPFSAEPKRRMPHGLQTPEAKWAREWISRKEWNIGLHGSEQEKDARADNHSPGPPQLVRTLAQWRSGMADGKSTLHRGKLHRGRA